MWVSHFNIITFETINCFNYLVVCIGLEPNIDLAKTAKLEVDPVNGGIVVNPELEARHDLFAVRLQTKFIATCS